MRRPTTARKGPPQLAGIVEAIRTGYGPQRIILFGSFAWGHPTPSSDVDLLIVKDTEEPFIERCRRVRRLIQRERRGLPLDLVVLTPEELDRRLARGDPLIEEILRAGVVLYAA